MQFCLEIVLRAAVATAMIGAGLRAENLTEVPHAVSVVRTDSRTGRLVRRVVLSGKTGPQSGAKPNAEIRATIEETARNLDVNPGLVDSVIQVESNYNPYAVSPKGAQGLMQLMPGTARRFGVTNSFDPQQNIEGGVRYLKFLQETFQDDRLAVAAYNAGEKAVAKYKNVPPYRETVDYVAKVSQKYSHAQHAAAKSAAPAKPAPVNLVEKTEPAEGETRHVVGYIDQEGRLHIATAK
jgi:soluble lytic murein transglycosylase-like protein